MSNDDMKHSTEVDRKHSFQLGRKRDFFTNASETASGVMEQVGTTPILAFMLHGKSLPSGEAEVYCTFQCLQGSLSEVQVETVVEQFRHALQAHNEAATAGARSGFRVTP